MSGLQRWAHWAEIVASVAIVISLVFVVQEIRYNTKVLERQAVLDRAEAFDGPFLEDSPLPAILEKIKTVDGLEPVEQALVARYDLAYEEAIHWVRHLALIWTVLESDFRASGRTDDLDAVAYALLGHPDHQLYWDNGAPQVTSGPFRAYVAAIRQARP